LTVVRLRVEILLAYSASGGARVNAANLLLARATRRSQNWLVRLSLYIVWFRIRTSDL
jgi:hypothetical protein